MSLVFSLPESNRVSATYQFLCEKIIPTFSSLKYVELEMRGNNIYCRNETSDNWQFLTGVCSGFAYGQGWL